MDALPEQLSHWQANALYIIGDKPVLQDIPEDLYPNCTFVPVEVRKRYRGREGGRDRERGGREGGREERGGEGGKSDRYLFLWYLFISILLISF